MIKLFKFISRYNLQQNRKAKAINLRLIQLIQKDHLIKKIKFYRKKYKQKRIYKIQK